MAADLTDFGVDVDVDEGDGDDGCDTGGTEEFHAPSYPRGRCPAITVNSRRRCKAPISRMKAADGMCGVHGREQNPWTIHGDPEFLIKLTGSGAARCRGLQQNGDRCTNSCGPLDHFCGTHSDVDCERVADLDEGELDVDLIQEALEDLDCKRSGEGDQ